MAVGNLGNPLEGPTADYPADGPDLKRCEQCGRVGIRLFETLKTHGWKPITVCSAKAACRKRWPKQQTDDAA
ncbi:hypothetical protein [Streptomyces sp. NPDC002908]|uniref:hypothetical protein n=1 Tax=Streptomyces sp. NPDC002908 TaxID=3364670 RepID=UPI0036A47AE2